MVAELPMFNPAAEDSCERICLAIASTLKRSYRRPFGPDNFENAISQINDELGKLAGLGQTQWIDRLNCMLAVKEGSNLNITSTGKVAAYLLRNGEFTDISCSAGQSHPLKTFENYASGKIRLGDLLLLSTVQLVNYLSLERLLGIMMRSNFLTGSQTILALLKEVADPQVSFGVLLNLQVAPGQAPEAEVDLEDFVAEPKKMAASPLAAVLAYLKTMFNPHRSPTRVPQVGLPKISLRQSLKKFGGDTKNWAAKTRNFLSSAKTSARPRAVP